MKVYLKQIDNFSLAAKAESNHWLSIDERVEDGGQGAVGGEAVCNGLSCIDVDPQDGKVDDGRRG